MKNVTQGYYDTDSKEFVTRATDYGSYGIPPELKSEGEEDDGYCKVYRTTDGKLFLDYKEAQAHEATVEAPVFDEVQELLEKAKILCSTNKDKFPGLAVIEDALKTIEKNPDRLMDKYYDSTCW